MDMTPRRWTNTCDYLREVFGRQDDHLAGLMARAVAAGLPEIAVSPDVGRLLMLLTMMAGEGAPARDPVAIEVGALAGYSGIWIARGLGPRGHLHTIEPNEKHAAFAQQAFQDAGVGDRVTLLRAPAPAVLHDLARTLGPGGADLVFLDAIKKDYGEYLRILRPVLRVGGLLIADNALGAGYWIDDPPGSNADRDAMDAFNRMVAADPAFVAACVPSREGVLIARRVR